MAGSMLGVWNAGEEVDVAEDVVGVGTELVSMLELDEIEVTGESASEKL